MNPINRIEIDSLQQELDRLKTSLKNIAYSNSEYILNQYLHRVFDIQEKIRVLKLNNPGSKR